MGRPLDRFCVFLLGGALLFASTGLTPFWRVPAVGSAAPDEAGEWFPCRDHHCGCVDAAMCRTHCCCYPKSAPPVGKPAGGSCCSTSEEDSKETDTRAPARECGAPSGRLVIRSAECAGRSMFWVLTAFCCHLPPPRFVFERPVRRAPVDLAVPVLTDQTFLPPDPPPPRAV